VHSLCIRRFHFLLDGAQDVGTLLKRTNLTPSATTR